MNRFLLLKSKRGVFLGLIASFVCISIIMVASNILLAGQMVSAVEQNTHHTNRTLLQQIEQDINA